MATTTVQLAAMMLVAGLAAPSPALAWGVPGCINLPEYERALGALEGMPGACNMSVEEASRIVAAQGNRPGGLLGRVIGGSAPPSPPVIVPPQAPRPEAGHRNKAVNR